MMKRGIVGLTGRRMCVLSVAAALGASVATLGAATPAGASSYQKLFTPFADCPYNTAGVTLCILSNVTSGEFHLGSDVVPINKTVTLQGGYNAKTKELVAATDGNTLSKTPLTVPGGLLGIELLGNLTEVTATAEIAGPIHLNLADLSGKSGPNVILPLKVKLDDTLLHLLGPACYVGSESEPVALNLTFGTTNPPPPNTPISGTAGPIAFSAEGRIITLAENTLVDNAFSAPGVNGCAGILAPVVDLAVDLKAGLPAVAGKNTAIMTGSTSQTESRIVKTETEIPEFGRCTKVEGVKEGKVTVYGGKYSSASCVTEAVESLKPGRFEWAVGPGPNRKFAGSGLAATLETVTKAKITCTTSASHGEYTGAKTETATFTFSGCESKVLHAPCQSSSASAGEIRTASLVGELGFIKDSEPLLPAVGLDYRPESGTSVMKFECGGVEEAVTGSVIASATPLEKTTTAYALKFKAAKGLQVPEQFEELATDTLALGSGEQIGLTSTTKGLSEEAIEIKARAF
jgi:hypothetical protein